MSDVMEMLEFRVKATRLVANLITVKYTERPTIPPACPNPWVTYAKASPKSNKLYHAKPKFNSFSEEVSFTSLNKGYTRILLPFFSRRIIPSPTNKY